MEDAVKYTRMALLRFADFKGRSRRAEYWWFTLAIFCWSILEQITIEIFKSVPILGALLALGVFLASLALIVPSLAVYFRRLHDTDRSAWWLLLLLIPLVGFVILIVWMATPGTVGANRFGPDPIAEEPVIAPSPIIS